MHVCVEPHGWSAAWRISWNHGIVHEMTPEKSWQIPPPEKQHNNYHNAESHCYSELNWYRCPQGKISILGLVSAPFCVLSLSFSRFSLEPSTYDYCSGRQVLKRLTHAIGSQGPNKWGGFYVTPCSSGLMKITARNNMGTWSRLGVCLCVGGWVSRWLRERFRWWMSDLA